MIFIRADMNDVIATGHIMRCMAIADAARKLGEETTFIVADGYAIPLFEKNHYKYHILNSDWRDMKGELPALIPYLKESRANVMLIDSYSVTEEYLSALKAIVKVAYLDDINRFKYPVAALICYGVYAYNNNYESRYVKSKLFLGPKYAPVRREFSNCKKKEIKDKVANVLILSGGTDNEDVLSRLLDVTIKYNVEKVTVICGRYYKRYDSIVEKHKADDRVVIKKSIDNIDKYMQEADIALSAGGNTLYELCACGTPTISFSLADNQFGNVYEFDKRGVILYAGDARTSGMIEKADSLIYKLLESKLLREELSGKMQTIIDGRGAYRLADGLMNL